MQYRALSVKLDDLDEKLDTTLARVEETAALVCERFADDRRVPEAARLFLVPKAGEQAA